MNNITNLTEEMVKSYMGLVGKNSMSPAEYLDFRKQTVMELSSGYLKEDIISTPQTIIPINKNTEEIKSITIEEAPVKEEKKVAGFTPKITALESSIKNEEKTKSIPITEKAPMLSENNFSFEKEEQSEEDDFFAIINKLKC